MPEGWSVHACEKFHKLSIFRRAGGVLTDMDGWLPILLLTGFGFAFAAGNVLLSQFLGPRQPTAEKLAPYECGMPAVGDARERQSVRFYLVAMIFLLFDIEIAFLYPWAMALRDLQWFGFAQIVVFFALLMSGFVYVWRKGALDWNVRD